MSGQILNVSRGDDPRATLKARVEAEFAAALDKKAALELTEVPAMFPSHQWEIFAVGPFQSPGQAPGRIIKLGETAYIATVVWMNPVLCATIAGFGADVVLNFWTSNTQTMQPVPAMNHYACVPITVGGGCFYVNVWEFKPTEAACLLETNICARLCSCEQKVVPGYAGFVRWVYDFDNDLFFGGAGYGFDRPIRYQVYDDNDKCPCPDTL